MLTLQVNDVIANASFTTRSVDIGNGEREPWQLVTTSCWRHHWDHAALLWVLKQ